MNNNERIKELLDLNRQEGLKLTLMMPTHRTAPENRQDPIVFKNLMSEAEKLLLEKLSRREIQGFMDQLAVIGADQTLFNNTLEGLVVYMTKDSHEILRLIKPLKETVVVAEHFNLLPTLEYTEKHQEVIAIDLSKDRFKLFEVDRYGIKEMEVEGIYQSFKELYDDQDIQSSLNFGSYRGGVGGSSFHGHKDTADEIDADTAKYFRYLDTEFKKKFKDDKRTLVVFSTTENIADFRALSDLQFYGIDKPYRGQSEAEIIKVVNEVLQKEDAILKEHLQERLDAAYGRRLVSNNLETIKKDVFEGKVEFLLIKDEYAKDLDEMVVGAYDTGAKVHFMEDLEEPVLAINRY